MKIDALRLAVLSAAFFALSSSSFGATVACDVATVADYRNQTDGCMIGAFTIKNVAWSSRSGGDYKPVSAADVWVTPVATSNSVQLNIYSGEFSVAGQGQLYALFDYTIDPPPPILDDLDLFLDAQTPVAPGWARVTANVCIGGLFVNSCENLATAVVEHYGVGDPRNVLSQKIQFSEPVNLIDVRTILELYANGASSQIDGYGTATEVLLQDSAVPEPASAVLALASLLIGGAVQRRRARKL